MSKGVLCAVALSGLGLSGALAPAQAAEPAGSGQVEMCFKGQTQSFPASAAAGIVAAGGYHGPCDRIENRTSLGDGYLQTFVHLNADGSPRAIGVEIDQAALDTLPKSPTNDGQTCWDNNGDGVTDLETECSGGHERVMWFPKLSGLPFKWIMFDYQPKGHGPAHVFDKGHFDLHYFIQDFVARNLIRTGPCGLNTNCDDYARAMKDIPPPFWPVGFENQGGVAGRMGNHLADPNSAPFNGEPFTQGFVYGQYDGHLTFFEAAVDVDWLDTKPEQCNPIKPPPAMELSGWYPREYCARYRADRGDYIMTLEDFEYRTAPQLP